MSILKEGMSVKCGNQTMHLGADVIQQIKRQLEVEEGENILAYVAAEDFNVNEEDVSQLLQDSELCQEAYNYVRENTPADIEVEAFDYVWNKFSKQVEKEKYHKTIDKDYEIAGFAVQKKMFRDVDSLDCHLEQHYCDGVFSETFLHIKGNLIDGTTKEMLLGFKDFLNPDTIDRLMEFSKEIKDSATDFQTQDEIQILGIYVKDNECLILERYLDAPNDFECWFGNVSEKTASRLSRPYSSCYKMFNEFYHETELSGTSCRGTLSDVMSEIDSYDIPWVHDHMGDMLLYFELTEPSLVREKETKELER